MPSRRRPRILPCEHSCKRRRIRMDAGSPSPCWSSMPEDLVALIAERVLAGDLLDYVRFRAACPQWRACTVDPRGRGVSDPRFHPRRWMMLPEGHGLYPGHSRLGGHARFFNCDTGAFVRVRIPELKDHFILDSPDGLLLLQRDADTAVRLLHPFTGDLCELPPLTSLIPQFAHSTDGSLRAFDEHKVQSFRILLSAAVSVAPATGTVTVVLSLEHISHFAHASGGDRSWILTSWSIHDVGVSRTLPFHGSLYMACWAWSHGESSILRLDPPCIEDDSPTSSSLLPLQTIATVPSELMMYPVLVECDSEILVIGFTDRSRSHLVVFRLVDLLQGGGPAFPLTSIGDRCLFVGIRSLSVSSKGLPSIVGNSIIFCSSIRGRLMQYNLGDDTFSPACDGDIFNIPPPSPHSIVHHLVTCSYPYFWNKGLIYCTKTKPRWRTKSKWRLGA